MYFKLVILSVMLPITGLAFHYKSKLAKGAAMGGAISNSKLFWLFFALSVYYVLNPLIGFGLDAVSSKALQALTWFLIFRALFQTILMYVIKKWTPKMGIAFNIAGVALSAYYLIKFYTQIDTESLLISPAYILLFINFFCFTFDTYYAYTFQKLVGDKTEGEQPIWYANEADPKFKQQNKITFFTNTFLSILFFYFLLIL